MTVRQMADPYEWLKRKWCPRCHVPLSLVRSVTLRDDCTKFVCLCCNDTYSELKRRAWPKVSQEAAQ